MESKSQGDTIGQEGQGGVDSSCNGGGGRDSEDCSGFSLTVGSDRRSMQMGDDGLGSGTGDALDALGKMLSKHLMMDSFQSSPVVSGRSTG